MVTHLASVVLVQDPAPGGINLLVALGGTTHAQSCIHVHVMASHIQANQALEDDCPARPGRAQENKKACSCATVCYHVEHSTEGGRLVEITCRIPIQGIQQARNTVKEGASTRVKWHIVEGSNGEDYACIP